MTAEAPLILTVELASLQDTALWAQRVADQLQPSNVLLLQGDLGAGKTTFAQFVIRHLMVEQVDIPSPTFPLICPYETSKGELWHVDLYRLESQEVPALGLEEHWKEGITMIEWPERLPFLPPPSFVDYADNQSNNGDTYPLYERKRFMAEISLSPNVRDDLKKAFLQSHGAPFDLRETFLAGDWSFRTYFRLHTQQSWFAPQVVLMDAPPPQEEVFSFLKIASLLRDGGVRAPEVYGFDAPNGFVLLEDFGDVTYRQALLGGGDKKKLYQKAIDVLLQIETIPCRGQVPDFNLELLLKEMTSFWHWAMEKPLEGGAKEEAVALWEKALAPLEALQGQQSILVLRDYHVANLMVLPGEGIRSCGVLDFQDAVFGSQAYDLMSLLQDIRIEVGDAFEQEMRAYYLSRQPANFDREGFLLSYTLLGLQRASKILGILLRRVRKYHKTEILVYLPRVWHEIHKGLTSPLARDLKPWFEEMFPSLRTSQNA